MNQQLKDKLAKIQELINRGSTEGERKAAQRAFDRIVKENNIDESKLNELHLSDYYFTYSTDLEPRLLAYVALYFFPDIELQKIGCKVKYRYNQDLGVTVYTRAVKLKLTYLQYVTIDCAYEYFRRHMRRQYNKLVKPLIDKHRSNKQKKIKRNKLNPVFLEKYIIKSKLIQEKHVEYKTVEEMSMSEIKEAIMFHQLEGGTYNQQVSNTKLLNNV